MSFGSDHGKQSALLWRVLGTVHDRLGFDVVSDEAFKELVLARIIEHHEHLQAGSSGL